MIEPEDSRRALSAEIALVALELERYLKHNAAPEPSKEEPGSQAISTSQEVSSESNLALLCSIFRLSRFERALLALCAGVEFDEHIASLCKQAHGHPHPFFALALRAFPDPNWDALSPDAPLRCWRLVEIGSAGSLFNAPIRIDERILHFLLGVRTFDERLGLHASPVQVAREALPSHIPLAQRIQSIWCSTLDPPLIHLVGGSPADAKAIAIEAAFLNGVDARVLCRPPRTIESEDLFIRLWQREWLLEPNVLLVERDSTDLDRLASDLPGFLVLAGGPPHAIHHRTVIRLQIPRANHTDNVAIWRGALRSQPWNLNGEVDLLAEECQLTPAEAEAVIAETASEVASDATSDELFTMMRKSSLRQARLSLEGTLAQRLRSNVRLADVVLPDAQVATMREIIAHVRHGRQVFNDWGMAHLSTRGFGVCVLFSGPSGTGKTMAAEALASELIRDVYRIDLAGVVSKYIGETEKNLDRIFSAADGSDAILLFDEADALFGKRTEVKDSHDRYANIEISYLLQRMEAYEGLAILTTNFKESMDAAFLRRLRFVVQFPFPDVELRHQIWQHAFSPATPVNDLQFEKLAQLKIAGGSIRNIAVGAAFLAADDGQTITMHHLLTSARREYEKLERPLLDSEVAGWV